MILHHWLSKLLRPQGKQAFLSNCAASGAVLDVGCGNNSVIVVKRVLPNAEYTGVDIFDYNLTEKAKRLIDDYVLTSPDKFVETIDLLDKKFDTIVCSHNLEHVFEPYKLLKAISSKLKDGGNLYLSFPCAASTSFPSRRGTLNYFDDETHQKIPPDLKQVINLLTENHLHITFAQERYRPVLMRLLGFAIEPLSIRRKRVLLGTWEYYGFETVIHAKKLEVLK